MISVQISVIVAVKHTGNCHMSLLIFHASAVSSATVHASVNLESRTSHTNKIH
jgi:hypothetical protein